MLQEEQMASKFTLNFKNAKTPLIKTNQLTPSFSPWWNGNPNLEFLLLPKHNRNISSWKKKTLFNLKGITQREKNKTHTSQRERQRVFHLIIHSLKGHNGKGLARTKPKARNSIWNVPTGSRDPTAWAVCCCCCFPGSSRQGTGSEVDLPWLGPVFTWGVGLMSSSLPHCANNTIPAPLYLSRSKVSKRNTGGHEVVY